jgi:Tol biopolymer transport system component
VTGGADAKGPGLFKIASSGTALVRLTKGIALNPVWAADDSMIVYLGANMGGKLPLLAVRPDGTPLELPKITVQRDGERVRFSPVGSRLIYTQGVSPSAQDFWLLDLVTMTSRQISHLASTATIRAFDVTPDGKQIIFDRLRDNADIALIDLPR